MLFTDGYIANLDAYLENNAIVKEVAYLTEIIKVVETQIETLPANSPLFKDLFERLRAFEAQVERQPKKHLPYEIQINGLFYRVLAFGDTLTHLQAAA